MTEAELAVGCSVAAAPSKARSLLSACLAHALHDGYTDGLYAFMPVWQAQFHLTYSGLAAIRALYYGVMGGLQVPADNALHRLSPRAALVSSILIAAAGFVIMALPLGLAGLCVGLVVAGIGSSIQHPRGSQLVTQTYGAASRAPLGVYNFSGDLGKAALPAVAALLIPVIAWRPILGMMALLGVGVVVAVWWLAPSASSSAPGPKAAAAPTRRLGGFGLLAVIGALDTATRMGYLLFLPFLIHGHGGSSAMVGLGLALLFIGGALGKAACSWLGQYLGVVGSVVATEIATGVLIVFTLFTPLTPMLIVLPLLGVVLNGTSSVLYGTVPELAPKGDTGRAFAIFYTSVIGSGGVAPILYGIVADHSGQTIGALAAALTAALIVPLVLALGPFLRTRAQTDPETTRTT